MNRYVNTINGLIDEYSWAKISTGRGHDCFINEFI